MIPLTPTSIAPPFARYSHGVMLPPGQRLIRTSGQLVLSQDGTVPPDVFDQAMICFDNIKAILKAGDMDFDDICHLSAYVTDRAHMAGYMKARDTVLANVPEDALPSSTVMIVSGFTRAEFKVEIEVWAAKAETSG